MKIILLFVFIIFSFYSNAQTVRVVDIDKLEDHIEGSDTVFIINFWATWCKPCIEELPYFLQLEKELKSEPVKFYFVSLDDVKYKESRVVPFAEKYEMKNVLILDAGDPNEWIPVISDEWTGSIPATLFKKNYYSKFVERQLTYKDLKEIVDKTKGAE